MVEIATHPPTGLQLVRVTERPFNAETPLAALTDPLTPTSLFYVRNNFDVPRIEPSAWRLTVDGLVEEPFELSLAALQAMGSRSQRVTLECAGNGRRLMEPLPPGTPWHLGAVGTARFRGVALSAVLARARPEEGAVEVVFHGADEGDVQDGRRERFTRSLPLQEAQQAAPLLAWEMNDEPLTPDHGAPLRLVVPGWYGVASVKWLTRIEVVAQRFAGWFQRERYVYESAAGIPDGTPVTRMRVRALIAAPRDGEVVASGPLEARGLAWSGAAAVSRVEVSPDGGGSWSDAELAGDTRAGLATAWRWLGHVDEGEHVLAARATDAAGNVQPLEVPWNAHGYGNNVVQRVTVRVT